MPQPTPELPPLTVVSLKVDSFMRIVAAHVHPDATGLVEVRGKNGQGKSSLIQSMLSALKGDRPPLPITEGAHGGSVVVDLGELVVEETLTRDANGKAKAGLVVKDKHTGNKRGSPRALLKELTNRLADPVAFLEAKPEEQVKTALGVLGLDEKLAGLEGLAEVCYDKRRDLGRDRDRLAKALQEIEHEVSGFPAPPSEGSIEALTDQLRAAEEHNAVRVSAAAAMEALEDRGKRQADRITELEAELEEARAAKIATAEEWKVARDRFKALGDRIETEPYRAQLLEHEEASKHAGRRELLESTRQQHADADEQWQAAEGALAEARGAIATLLAETKFPVEGMSYSAETKALTIGGVPLEQASQSERVKVAAAIAMAGNPTIRVIFVRDGSLFDEDSKAQLAGIALENRFQCWFEEVDSNADGVGIYIEDGQAFEEGGK